MISRADPQSFSLRDWSQQDWSIVLLAFAWRVFQMFPLFRQTTVPPTPVLLNCWSYRSTESISNVSEMLVWRVHVCQCTSSTTLHCTGNHGKFERVWSWIILTSCSNACIGHHEQNFSGSAQLERRHASMQSEKDMNEPPTPFILLLRTGKGDSCVCM